MTASNRTWSVVEYIIKKVRDAFPARLFEKREIKISTNTSQVNPNLRFDNHTLQLCFLTNLCANPDSIWYEIAIQAGSLNYVRDSVFA